MIRALIDFAHTVFLGILFSFVLVALGLFVLMVVGGLVLFIQAYGSLSLLWIALGIGVFYMLGLVVREM